MILFIKHIDIEGPGILGNFFKRKGCKVRMIDLGAGDVLPSSLDDLQAVVVLGGPMNVYEEDKYPFLKGENEFIRNVVKNEVPFLGICLGAQLLAKACGAKVGKSAKKEIGFFKVELTPEGQRDVLFMGIKRQLDVYQWHEDTFEIPQGGKLLATSKGCPHQAFRIGLHAYGLQFHVEITDKSIKEWSQGYFKKRTAEFREKTHQMLEDYHEMKPRYDAAGYQIFENFARIISFQKVVV